MQTDSPPWSLCILHFALNSELPTFRLPCLRVLELQRHQGTNVPRSPIRVSLLLAPFSSLPSPRSLVSYRPTDLPTYRIADHN
jgi:hypothetical protein